MSLTKLSTYLSFLLRHQPEALELNMDRHGWVDVQELIQKVNDAGRYRMTIQTLERIVAEDRKGRYRFDSERKRIKACQGHSIAWVEPELEQRQPPQTLFHGTTQAAAEQIFASGAISRMKRHGVHMQADQAKAWQSARRWKGQVPLVLKIAAGEMAERGYLFQVSENGVWITESVPTEFVSIVSGNEEKEQI